MGDLISRQQAIKSMAEAIWHYPNELYSGLNAYQNAEALAKYGLEHLPSAKYCDNAKIELSKEDLEDLVAQKVKEIKETMSGNWIPCSERMPEEGQAILATITDNALGDVVILRKFYKTMYKSSVTAWIPLPEPYGGEQE